MSNLNDTVFFGHSEKPFQCTKGECQYKCKIYAHMNYHHKTCKGIYRRERSKNKS